MTRSTRQEETGHGRLPEWFRRPLRTAHAYRGVSAVLSELGLHTVCGSAQCPNRHECWSGGTATFMILGDRCTRNCRFCAVAHGPESPPQADEPERVAEAARRLNLRHVVVTSVTRDDLPDGGADLFARTIERLHEPGGVTVEVLTPDFGGDRACVDRVIDAGPEVFNHNLETVERLQPALRPEASYGCSLDVLRAAAERGGEAVLVKSGLMLGLGETDAEIGQSLRDLHAAGCRALTLGQYLAPTRGHAPVQRFVPPERFEEWARRAHECGFEAVASGPMVRSSYQAREMWETVSRARREGH
ncbi:lipoyl synthase [Kiritimatiella glycovorans]|uniref:Lipoyl synthase n=1 Tax=Kiritimatiella glycovorans TaxID=1307763 RepID=A0A0G3EJW1_9BACT|nr:lipoyl synthase [Kiritimatiella glycovorans]AKJ65080.1 Lipoyl synthase [Kiritimatiella glycovorans]